MERMDQKEKMLLLQLILLDIRGNWGWDNPNADRTELALTLANDLKLDRHVERIEDYRSFGNCSDGRHFRISYKYGGYEGMEALHGLQNTLEDKSEEFKRLADKYLTHPEFLGVKV